jgi:hypothetical protein
MDAPDLSLGEPGLWKYSFDYVPRSPAVFVNLYNNMWRTDYPYWVEGSWNSRVRVWPVRSGHLEQGLAVTSWEARLPLLLASVSGPAGALPAEQGGVAISRSGVLLTAFGPDPDGNPGTLLRVWDQSGTAGKLTITLPKSLKASRAQPVTLRGEKAGPVVPIRAGHFPCSLGAYAPASYILN